MSAEKGVGGALKPLGRVLWWVISYGGTVCYYTQASECVGFVEFLDSSRMLQAIAAVETGTTNLNRPSRKIGRAGERSAWQFTATTWSQYTSAPFTEASKDARLANLVAELHLRHLVADLKLRGKEPMPYNLALAWNAGPAAVAKNRVGPAARDYAKRVENIYRVTKTRR